MRPRERRWAVVPAAGQGSRFGAGAPKQYVAIDGRPMLSWTLGVLLAEPSLEAVVVALHDADTAWPSVPESRDPRVLACPGGARREHSVARALAAIADRAHADDWVLVHDAARPCLRATDLHALLAALADDPVGGLLAVPVADTLKRADQASRVTQTVPRADLWRALTPQMFRYGLLARALAACVERDHVVTDEAAAVEALGFAPRLQK